MSPRPRESRASAVRKRGTAPRAVAALASAFVGLTLAASPAAAAIDLGYDPLATKGGLYHIAAAVGAHESYKAGFTGKGIGVALIDTGVTPVSGLNTGNVVNGPDLSFDSQDPAVAHVDGYGHGTHLASIIAGRHTPGTPSSYLTPANFNGIAPDATLVNVKVGAHDGAVDVTQVIAAIDWVVEHRATHNIRVINLSYGTNSVQDPLVDPLTYAVENAWKKGIVVVVAGGNDGRTEKVLANPAQSQHVLAVGASDTKGTLGVLDDSVPDWATRGDYKRHVDVVAPGVSVHGLRVPGGYADTRNPAARVGSRFAKASGTSQAAAVVSGEVALLLQENPSLTPDQVKDALMDTAGAFYTASLFRGEGLTNVRRAQLEYTGYVGPSSLLWSSGAGSVEKARGTSHVSFGGVALTGEKDVWGKAWQPATWAAATSGLTAWNGGSWMGTPLTASSWSGGTWGTTAWAGTTWTGLSWRSAAWTGLSWREGTWTGLSWREGTWSGLSWRSADLASNGWV
ncbi:hypothetical protein NUM3379_41840 [Kineococcus sp. NUM-3379]